MGIIFNPFTANFDFIDEGGTQWLPPVATEASLPLTDADGSARIVLSTNMVYVFDSSDSKWHKATPEIGAFAGASTANGLSLTEVDDINVTDFQLVLHPADGTNPGGVSIGAQNFAGNKTFDDNVIITGDLTVNGTTTNINTTNLDVTDANITINNGGTQASADAADSGLTVEMSDATDVRLGYDSTLTSRMKVGDVGSEAEIATVSHAQALTNKTIVVASNTVTTAASGNLIATELNAALAELQTDIDGRATTALDNLASVAINTTLLSGAGTDLDLATNNDAVVDATATDSMSLTTGNKTAGTGNSGGFSITSGTSAGGVRGDLTVDTDSSIFIDIGSLVKDSTVAQNWWGGTLPGLELDGTSTPATNGFGTGLFMKGNGNQAYLLLGTEEQTSGTAPSADINMFTGQNSGTATGTTGGIFIYSGRQTNSGDTGQVQIYSETTTNGNTGPVLYKSGDANGGNSGNAELRAGNATGTRGNAIINGGQIKLTSAGSIDLTSAQRITNVTDPTSAQDVATKNYVDTTALLASSGDINETSFSLANNQVAAANVTGFAFANGTVRSFSAIASVEIDATADLFEVFEINGIQKGASWDISITNAGDNSLVDFTITSAGQLQYTSGNYSGFVSGSIKFRAITTSI